MKHTYKIIGMSCNGCKANVEKTLLGISGIVGVTIDLKSGSTEIEMSKHISLEYLQQEFLNAGLHYTINAFDSNEEQVDLTTKKNVKGNGIFYCPMHMRIYCCTFFPGVWHLHCKDNIITIIKPK